MSEQDAEKVTLVLTREEAESVLRAIATHLDRGEFEGNDVPNLYRMMTEIERQASK